MFGRGDIRLRVCASSLLEVSCFPYSLEKVRSQGVLRGRSWGYTFSSLPSIGGVNSRVIPTPVAVPPQDGGSPCINRAYSKGGNKNTGARLHLLFQIHRSLTLIEWRKELPFSMCRYGIDYHESIHAFQHVNSASYFGQNDALALAR